MSRHHVVSRLAITLLLVVEEVALAIVIDEPDPRQSSLPLEPSGR
jgi:hypothetical protein